MKRFTKSQVQRITIYLISVAMLVISVFVINGFKTSLTNNHDIIHESYQDARWDIIKSNIDAAIQLGEFGLINSSNKIQLDIKDSLDLDKLKTSLSDNDPYPEFDKILRNTLQKNVFTRESVGMDQNINSIFVMVNGRLIANYTHNKDFISSTTKLGDENSIYEIVEDTAYNKELCKNAIRKIENQQNEDIIIWQRNAPKNSDIPMYTNMTYDSLRCIFNEYGIEGLESYDILIPVYITEYGNIFGDYDTPYNVEGNNKLILVQRLNVYDYLLHYAPYALNDLDVSWLEMSHNSLISYIHIFECILYVAIVSYVLIVTVNINRIIDEQDYNDDDDEQVK